MASHNEQIQDSKDRKVQQPKVVAVFGAGVAGLTVAHELSRLGYKVSVYEANPGAGGFFRSARIPEHDGMPSEYSWHGLGPWYHNVFDIMKQIPFDAEKSVYEQGLSRPIKYGIAPDNISDRFDESLIFGMFKRFRLSGLDYVRWGWLLLKLWSSNRRTKEYYSRINASAAWKPLLSHLGWSTWRATFGPWIGSDWSRVSLHHVGLFFRYNLMSGRRHVHPPDDEGSTWIHGPGKGWLLLRGPSSEFWFDKWVQYLEAMGVMFHWETSLHRLIYNGTSITEAYLDSGEVVKADVYVAAINPFTMAEILTRTPELAAQNELRKFFPLIQDGPHSQVSFRIAFSEKIHWSRKRSALVIADSEFNLTLFPEEQVWNDDVSLGKGVMSLWTGTACTGVAPGRIYGLPLEHCTREQFEIEVMAQLKRCKGLEYLLKKANEGRSLDDFSVVRFEVWHEWKFDPSGIKPRQPKWVMSTNTQPHLPDQKTPIPNLLLAGAHTRTDADIWSIEGAVESGRRAAQIIEPSITWIPQYKSLWLRTLSVLDDALYALGMPHVLDCVMLFAAFCLVLSVLL